MEGVAVCRDAPILSHLFFANNSLIFCKASLQECDSLQHVLKVYEDAFGQQLNRAKTSLFFSSNTDQQLQEETKTRFGAQIIRQHEKYFGLPSLVGRCRVTIWGPSPKGMGSWSKEPRNNEFVESGL